MGYRKVYISPHPSKFAVWIIQHAAEPSHRYPAMTRFFAHLCLFLQMIDMPVSPYAIQIILEAYLQVLEVRLELDSTHNGSGSLKIIHLVERWPAGSDCYVRRSTGR